jgi:hypothetical protein
VLAPEHLLRFRDVHFAFKVVEAANEIAEDVFALIGPLDQHAQVIAATSERFAQRGVLLEASAPLEHFLRLGLVLPEIRFGNALFELGHFLRRVCGLKDTSVVPRHVYSGPRIVVPVRRAQPPQCLLNPKGEAVMDTCAPRTACYFRRTTSNAPAVNAIAT